MSGKIKNLKRRCLQEKYAQLEESSMDREQMLIDRINELRGEIGGYKESLDAMNAILTASIMQTGSITIEQDTINDIMRSGRYAVGHFDPVKREYALHMPEGVKPDGREEESPGKEGEDVDVNVIASEQG